MSGEVVIVDLGTGNLRSVEKAVAHVSSESAVSITSDPGRIRAADHLVLPGQGAIGTWMAQLDRNPDLHQAVVERIRSGPVLGICLGLQALFERSEENDGTPGLGLMPGSVRQFDAAAGLKVPHMGWNTVEQKNGHPLWQGIDSGERFYFVHSYYAINDDVSEVMATCDYGSTFTAAAASGQLFATQFHPEKSQQAGLRLLRNFIKWNGET